MSVSSKIYSIREVGVLGLVQLTVWLDESDLSWLRNECNRINSDENRMAVIVRDSKGRFALFVNDMTRSVEKT